MNYFAKKRAIATIAAIAVILTVAVAAVALGLQTAGRAGTIELPDPPVDIPDMLSMKDITLPEGIDLDELGIFLYKGGAVQNPASWVRYDQSDVPFDETRKTVFYAHGMGEAQYMPFADRWRAAGYNVATFLWGPFSRFDPATGQNNVWTASPDLMRWINRDGDIVKDNPSDHSVAEIYAACYYDFLSTHRFRGDELIIAGHSLGGQMSIAISNILLQYYKAGSIGAEFLPDRVALLDPYITGMSVPNATISWSGMAMTEGINRVAAETAAQLLEYGIPVEFYRTSAFVAMPALLGSELSKQYNARFMEDVVYVEYDYTGDDIFERAHTIVWDLYLGGIVNPAYDDQTSGRGYGIGIRTPYVYSLMRTGKQYKGSLNGTPEQFDDDTMASVGIDAAVIGGIAFCDENGNGRMDERMGSRVSGVKVELIDAASGKVIDSTVTGEGGWYRFFVKDVSKQYCVRAAKDGARFSAVTDGAWYNANKIAGGTSEAFGLTDRYDVQIINIGILK